MLTFEDLINNPVGSGSGNVAARYLIKNVMQSRAQALIEGRRVTYKVYFDSKEDIFIHFKVGSESFEKLSYDVVFHLSPQSEVQANIRSISKYSLKLMSNIPAFAYTYAYTLNESDLVIDFLKDKFDDQFWTMPPLQRNPAQTFGFEKSLQFAALTLKRAGMMDINQLKLVATKVSDVRKTIHSEFEAFSSKLLEYHNLKMAASKVIKERKDAKRETRSTKIGASRKISSGSGRTPRSPGTARKPQRGN